MEDTWIVQRFIDQILDGARKLFSVPTGPERLVQ